MRFRKLLLASAVLLIIGLVSLWSKWNGTAGINAGYPISAWGVNFCESVKGWPALIGVISTIAALFVFLGAVITAEIGSTKD